jgi:hypothetical protein
VLVTAVAKLLGDINYTSYRKEYNKKILPKVDKLLSAAATALSNGGGTPEVRRFQEHISNYGTVAYRGYNVEVLFLIHKQIHLRV